MFRSKQLTAYGVLQCLYVDDGAFPFGTREDLRRGMELIYHHFARFGLEMHINVAPQSPKLNVFSFPHLSSSSSSNNSTLQLTQSNEHSVTHAESRSHWVLTKPHLHHQMP